MQSISFKNPDLGPIKFCFVETVALLLRCIISAANISIGTIIILWAKEFIVGKTQFLLPLTKIYILLAVFLSFLGQYTSNLIRYPYQTDGFSKMKTDELMQLIGKEIREMKNTYFHSTII